MNYINDKVGTLTVKLKSKKLHRKSNIKILINLTILIVFFFNSLKLNAFRSIPNSKKASSNSNNEINFNHQNNSSKPFVRQKHIYIIQNAKESISISHFFSIENPNSHKTNASLDLLYPIETFLISALEGVQDNDIKISTSQDSTSKPSQFYIKKDFEPKKTIIALNYKIKTHGSHKASFNFITNKNIEKISFLIKKTSNLKINAITENINFLHGVPDMLSDSNFLGIQNDNLIPKNQKITLTVYNLSMSRFYFYLVGGIFFTLLVLASMLVLIKYTEKLN